MCVTSLKQTVSIIPNDHKFVATYAMNHSVCQCCIHTRAPKLMELSVMS